MSIHTARWLAVWLVVRVRVVGLGLASQDSPVYSISHTAGLASRVYSISLCSTIIDTEYIDWLRFYHLSNK